MTTIVITLIICITVIAVVTVINKGVTDRARIFGIVQIGTADSREDTDGEEVD